MRWGATLVLWQPSSTSCVVANTNIEDTKSWRFRNVDKPAEGAGAPGPLTSFRKPRTKEQLVDHGPTTPMPTRPPSRDIRTSEDATPSESHHASPPPYAPNLLISLADGPTAPASLCPCDYDCPLPHAVLLLLPQIHLPSTPVIAQDVDHASRNRRGLGPCRPLRRAHRARARRARAPP